MTDVRGDATPAATTKRPLIGRRRELEELSDAFADSTSGRGRLLLITGDPGIGKTRLAEELAQGARAHDASVHWGSCWEVGGAPTFWPWLEVFRGIAREVDAETVAAWAGESAPMLAPLVPGLGELALVPGASAGDEARFQLFDAVTGFLDRAAASRPVVLVLDDIHAADRASLLLLHFLGRRLRDLRLLIVATSRDLEVERDPDLSDLIGNIARLGRRLPLGGLDADEVAALVEQATGAPPSADMVEAVLASTGGNPFFVDEVARLLATGKTTLPAGVKHTVRQNLSLLPAPVQEILATASVLGREFPLDQLAAVAGRPAEDLLEKLGSAASARMVRQLTRTPGRFQFAHALIRDTLYEELGPARRQALHLAVAEHLETAYGQDSAPHLAELAHHFTQAASEKAVDYSTRAARRAMSQLAYEEAAVLYRRALDMLEPGEDLQRMELLLALDDAYSSAGSRAGEDAVREALQIGRRVDRADLFARASLHVLPEDETVAALDEAIARLGEGDPALRAEVLSVLVNRLRATTQYERVLATAAEALHLARLAGDRRVLGSALSANTQALQCSHELDQRRAASEELLTVAEELDDARLKVLAYVAIVTDCLQAGDVARLDQTLARFAEAATESRRPGWAHIVVTWRAMRALLDGRLADAEPLVLQQLAMVRALQSWIPPALMAQLFHLRREQGRLADIEAEARELAESSPQFPWSHRLALLHLDLGRPDEAREIFERVAARDFTDLRPDNLTFSLPLLSELAWALDDRRSAALLYERVLPYDGQCLLASGAMVYCTGAAARYLGLLAFTLGRLDDAVRHLDEAATKHTHMGARLLLAHTECDLVMVRSARGAPGDHERAAQAADRVRATSEELGLVLVARRLDRSATVPAVLAQTAPPATASFKREGDTWAITFEGHTARVRHARGMELISRLLSDPGREFHALDLEQGAPGAARANDPSSELAVDAGGSAGPALDEAAKREYKRRLGELDQEIDQATLDNDPGRRAGAEEERDFLVSELRRAVGLGGRDRPTSSAAERARVNVTRAIRSGLARVAEHHPVLGEHLAVTIHTGIFCSYTPDPRVPIRWDT
ncbi:MAG: AAA family ATPase [Actinomycetota bacterium]